MGKSSSSTAPPRWKVDQKVLIVGRRRRDGGEEGVITKVGRTWVHAAPVRIDGQPSSWESRYRISDGVEDGKGFTPVERIVEPEVYAAERRDARLRDAVREAGWRPHGYGERPIEEWRAVAAALGLEVEK